MNSHTELVERTPGSTTLAEEVYGRLRTDIVAGRFRPGMKLRLHRICEVYDVGASPLREALSRLVSAGLVVQESQRGFHVRPASSADLDDITQTRIRLETMALRLSIEHGADEWEARLVSAYHMLSKLDPAAIARPPQREEWESRHREFHFQILSGCSSPWLLHFCAALYDQFDRYRRLADIPAQREQYLASQHGKLVQALLTHRGDEAAALLEEHIAATAAAIARGLKLGGHPRAQGRRKTAAVARSKAAVSSS